MRTWLTESEASVGPLFLVLEVACAAEFLTRLPLMQGHYVPQLAQMIVDGNAKPGAQQLNLQGFLLGARIIRTLVIVSSLLNLSGSLWWCILMSTDVIIVY